ncbi:YczE/YyaS/YitT family protein [Nocardiopsis ansamitocini]|uniref:Membrane protein n=1 Tax=Nocardiopsis ansamitocini TaxID=1670832 RepID=A0A9W6UFU3_9ACTN|nr:hypothetical protein [Nocardiopsis ansamitocini]GLU45841.1 membrane protein [Nocardiopsis ansamitocini]
MAQSNLPERTFSRQLSRLSGLSRQVFLSPLLPRPRARRLVQLYTGLFLFGLGAALQVSAHLGGMPWDVLHQGLHLQTGWSIGTWSILIGMLVVLLWIPLRQRPGLGTISNVVVVGLSLDLSLLWLPEPESIPLRIMMLCGGILVTGVGTGLYIGARLGPGPRDGLMTGLAAKGLSLRLARTVVEVSVVILGFLLGGTAGVGTVLFVVAIGPLAQFFIPMFTIDEAPEPPVHP